MKGINMTEKDLKKLNRKQLLELLLLQTQKADQLQIQLDEAMQKLNDKTIIHTKAGSIAEAALKLNGVFSAAEEAALQYVDNVRKQQENELLIHRQTAKESERLAAKMLADTESKCREREELAEKRIAEYATQLKKMEKQKQILEEFFYHLTEKTK